MHADTVFHIAFVGSRSHTDDDNTGIFVEEVGSRLAAAGHRITVFYCAPRWAAQNEYSRKNVRYVPIRRGLFRPHGADVIALAPLLRDVDLVYLSGGAVAYGFLPKPLRKNMWVDVQSLRNGRSRLPFEGMVLSRAQRIITDTHALREELERRHGSLTSAEVIPRGAEVIDYVDPEQLVDWELASGCFYLMRSPLEPAYRVREIIEGFLQAKSTFPLVVIGDIENTTRYTAHLRTLAGARVRFIGKLNHSQRLRTLYAHARGYFHGDSSGRCNATLLQAMGSGNIVIAHDNPYTRELAGDLAAYFHASEDIPAAVAWADNLEGNRRRDYTRVAHERIAAQHDWDHVTARFTAALIKAARDVST